MASIALGRSQRYAPAQEHAAALDLSAVDYRVSEHPLRRSRKYATFGLSKVSPEMSDGSHESLYPEIYMQDTCQLPVRGYASPCAPYNGRPTRSDVSVFHSITLLSWFGRTCLASC